MRRSTRSFSALVALVAFVATFGLPFLAPRHAWVDDPDAGWAGLPPLGTHAPRVETATAAREGEHCAVCHWMRALGSSMAGAAPRRIGRGPIGSLAPATHPSLLSAPVATGPARAPPSSIA